MNSNHTYTKRFEENHTYLFEDIAPHQPAESVDFGFEALSSSLYAAVTGEDVVSMPNVRASVLPQREALSSQSPLLDRLAAANPHSLYATIESELLKNASDPVDFTDTAMRITPFLVEHGTPEVNQAFCRFLRRQNLKGPLGALIESCLAELAVKNVLKRSRDERLDLEKSEGFKKCKQRLSLESTSPNERLRRDCPNLGAIPSFETLNALVNGWLKSLGKYDCSEFHERKSLIEVMIRFEAELLVFAKNQSSDEISQFVDELTARIHEIVDCLDRHYEPAGALPLSAIMSGQVEEGEELSLHEMILRAELQDAAAAAASSSLAQEEPPAPVSADAKEPSSQIFRDLDKGHVNLDPLKAMTCQEIIESLPLLFSGLKNSASLIEAFQYISLHLQERDALGLDTFSEGDKEGSLTEKLTVFANTLGLATEQERALFAQFLSPFGILYGNAAQKAPVTNEAELRVISEKIIATVGCWKSEMAPFHLRQMSKESGEAFLLKIAQELNPNLEVVLDFVPKMSGFDRLRLTMVVESLLEVFEGYEVESKKGRYSTESQTAFQGMMVKFAALLRETRSDARVEPASPMPPERVYYGSFIEDVLMAAKSAILPFASAPFTPEVLDTIEAHVGTAIACSSGGSFELDRNQKSVVAAHFEDIFTSINLIQTKAIVQGISDEINERFLDLADSVKAISISYEL